MGQAEALLAQLIDLYIKHRDKTVSSRIASYVGGQKADANCVVILERRALDTFSEVSCEGVLDVTSKRLLEWMSTIGIEGDAEEEIEELFLSFDADHNGVLDQDEWLALCRFINKINRCVTHELTFSNIDDHALTILSDCGVCVCGCLCVCVRVLACVQCVQCVSIFLVHN